MKKKKKKKKKKNEKRRKEAIKHICKTLKIPASHAVHLGRIFGTRAAEENDAPKEELRNLGNWDPTTQEKFYSTKLPMRILRSKAGFTKANGMVYNPRVAVEPPESLACQVFPWVDPALDVLEAATEMDEKDRRTAFAFLSFMKELRTVVLQDAAVMLDDPVRSRHAVFQLPVFQTDEFKDYCVTMRNSLAQTENPLDASVDWKEGG